MLADVDAEDSLHGQGVVLVQAGRAVPLAGGEVPALGHEQLRLRPPHIVKERAEHSKEKVYAFIRLLFQGSLSTAVWTESVELLRMLLKKQQ